MPEFTNDQLLETLYQLYKSFSTAESENVSSFGRMSSTKQLCGVLGWSRTKVQKWMNVLKDYRLVTVYQFYSRNNRDVYYGLVIQDGLSRPEFETVIRRVIERGMARSGSSDC